MGEREGQERCSLRNIDGTPARRQGGEEQGGAN